MPGKFKKAEPTVDIITPKLGKPHAAAPDSEYFSDANIAAFEKSNIEPFIPAGDEPHHKNWRTFFKQ